MWLYLVGLDSCHSYRSFQSLLLVRLSLSLHLSISIYIASDDGRRTTVVGAGRLRVPSGSLWLRAPLGLGSRRPRRQCSLWFGDGSIALRARCLNCSDWLPRVVRRVAVALKGRPEATKPPTMAAGRVRATHIKSNLRVYITARC